MIELKKVEINGEAYLEIPKPIEEVILEQEDIDKLKESYEDKDLVDTDEVDKLKEDLTKIGKDSIILAKLFIIAHDYFVSTIYSIEYKALLNKVRIYFLQFKNKDVLYLRKLLEDYGDGEEIGSYYLGEDIKNYVYKERDKIINLVNLFFYVFGEDN